jgi:REase_DpnII-MboI
MSTRTNAGRIEALVEEITTLEELGGQIQGHDETTALANATQLTKSYLSWYASALALLPEDLKERFRFEYQGNFIQYRIKHFLNDPFEQSMLYSSANEEQRKTLNVSPWQYPYMGSYRSPLTAQKQILLEAQARLGFSADTLEALELLERVTRRLPISFAVMRRMVQKRPGMDVADEYDVQRILQAILVTLFEEVESEEPTPKKAGVSSRLDFLLKRERIAVETKMVGRNLTVAKLHDDLAKDILYFRAHSHAGSLFIFIYDPDRKIMNSAGFEAGLHSDSDEFPVRVVVAS